MRFAWRAWSLARAGQQHGPCQPIQAADPLEFGLNIPPNPTQAVVRGLQMSSRNDTSEASESCELSNDALRDPRSHAVNRPDSQPKHGSRHPRRSCFGDFQLPVTVATDAWRASSPPQRASGPSRGRARRTLRWTRQNQA